jgi:solute:Na+ symporter, SSS family
MELVLTNLDWVVASFVIVGSLGFGLYMAYVRHAGASSSDYFLGGRKIKWPVIGASIFATNIGAEHLVGLSGDAYRYGLSAGTVELTTAITLGFACAVLFPYYIKNKIYTIPEFLEMRFTPRARTFFSGFMLIISIMTKLAFTLFAGALVLNSLLGVSVMTTVIWIGFGVAIFTILGGLTAVAYNSSVQVIIILVGTAAMLIMGLSRVGGWGELMERAPDMMSVVAPYDDPVYPFWGILATAFYAGIFYWGIDQVNVQRALAAPNLHHARWGAMFATLLKLLPIFLFALPGVIAYALFPDELQGEDTRQTFVLLLNELLPSGLRGLLLASLAAAIITSLTSVLNSVSTLIVRDFVVEFSPKKLSEKAQVSLGRWVIIPITILGIGAAYLVYASDEGLYKYLQTISAYLVIPVFPAIFFGIVSKRVTTTGALVSVIVGVLLSTVFVIDQLMGPEAGARVFSFLHYPLTLNFGYRGLWAEIIITIVLFTVSAFTAKTPAEKLEKTTINWSGKVPPWEGITDWRLHLIILSVITVFLYAWLA